MANDVKKIVRKDWVSNFNLIGEAKVDDEYTFKIDERSEKSQWIYNSMNLGVWCGEESGSIYCEAIGGYSENGSNVIYAHGKDENGRDDFEKQIIVDFEDRFNDDVLEEIGDLSFITVGLEKTDKDKTFYKKFLSMYDAIAYVKEHLKDGMVVNVKGNLKYSTYNDATQVRKNITSIVLSKADDVSKYKATFTQSILLDKDSASLKNIDKDKSVMYVDARVLDYVKEINGVEIKGQYPFNKQFEFKLNLNDGERCKKIYEKMFKVKKGITQINMEGNLVEGGAIVTATLDDLTDDIKDLIAMGIYSEEEALAKCTVNGNRERRMILEKPQIKVVGDDENKTPVVSIYPERYEEEDLQFDLFREVNEDDELPFGDGNNGSDDGLDWLSQL